MMELDDNPAPPLSESELRRKIDAINSATNLPRRARPVQPVFNAGTSALSRIKAIQKYIESFEYNHTEINFFEITGVRKNTSCTRLIEIAHRIMQEAVPIKCVEAAYLGVALTHNMPDIARVPLIFYSSIDGHRYGHIVLCVRVDGRFGAVGLSRRPNLMYKEPVYSTVYDLLLEYKHSYARWGHKIVKIKLGPALPHDGDSMVGAVVDWNKFVYHVVDDDWSEVESNVTKYMRSCLRRPAVGAHSTRKGIVGTVHELKRQRAQKQPGGGSGAGAGGEGSDEERGHESRGRRGSESSDDGDELNSPQKSHAAPRPRYLGV